MRMGKNSKAYSRRVEENFEPVSAVDVSYYGLASRSWPCWETGMKMARQRPARVQSSLKRRAEAKSDYHPQGGECAKVVHPLGGDDAHRLVAHDHDRKRPRGYGKTHSK